MFIGDDDYFHLEAHNVHESFFEQLTVVFENDLLLEGGLHLDISYIAVQPVGYH